jgi:hypothetical protein
MSISRTLCCTLLMALSSLAASATTTVAVDRNGLPAESLSDAAFDADPGRGQAWIVVSFLDNGGEEATVASQRLSIPGLTYDAATRTIHLQDGDRDVTCAVAKKVLWVTRFKSTEQCPIRVRQVAEEKVYGVAASEKARFLVEVGAAR